MRPELIQASELLRQNTPDALEKAVGLLQQTVFSFSMKMCGHRQDAEDTAQDVLFGSLKHLTRIQEPHALAAWLYTVTRNRCRRMRAAPAESRSRKVSLDELMPNQTELKQMLADVGESPEQTLLSAEQESLLHQAILKVPPALRIVLVLHDMEELDSRDVARILALQEGTVRVRLHRARLFVRKEMDRILSGAPPDLPSPKSRGSGKAGRPQECRELFARLSDYLDQRVDAQTSSEMQAHIEACPACVAFLRELRLAIERCRAMKAQCDPAVAARMRKMFTQEFLRLRASRPAPALR